MSLNKITFVIPARNNLEFLKLAYKSIRNLKTKHEVLILNDASIDGTQEWIDSQDDDDLISYINEGPERVGIVGMFDKGIEMARTDIIIAFHADMVVCEDFDVNILKHLKKGVVVSGTRVEPPLHPEGPEKIIYNFGVEVDEFNFENWYTVSETFKKDRCTEGIFAPWCMYKEDFLAIGGHDELFSPQSKEDSDLFNRFQLKGYKFVQPWDALVYHFTSRGSRFNKYSGGSAGKNSQEWLQTTTNNMNNFIRKWGSVVRHDSLMKPIISPVYKKALHLQNSTPELLKVLEPWFTSISTDLPTTQLSSFIKETQPKTMFDLSDKFKVEAIEDIVVHIDGNKFDQQDYQNIQNLNYIIQQSGEDGGKFMLGNLNITILKIKDTVNDLINIPYERTSKIY